MIRLLAAALAVLSGPALAQQTPSAEKPSAVSDPSATAGTVAPPVPSDDRNATGSTAPGGTTGHSQSGYGTFDPNRPDARSATGAGQPPAR